MAVARETPPRPETPRGRRCGRARGARILMIPASRKDTREREHILREIDGIIGEVRRSGGDVDPNTEVDEWHLLHLERIAFLEICRSPRSLERMQAMLTTGKPLRN